MTMPSEFESWWDFRRFSHAVRHTSRYIHDSHVTNFLDTLLQTSSARHRKLSEGEFLWRAQLGGATYKQDGVAWGGLAPHPSARMKPLRRSAHEGRVNPKGIPSLYLATDKETAMAEVRPWIGSMVSAGTFRIARNLAVIDFSLGHNSDPDIYLEEPPAAEREKSVWAQVDRAFSEPVSADPGTADYVPTQVIAEFFRKQSIDGVAYKSRLGNGLNIALFDLDAAVLVSCELCPVQSLTFKFGEAENYYNMRDAEA